MWTGVLLQPPHAAAVAFGTKRLSIRSASVVSCRIFSPSVGSGQDRSGDRYTAD
jgi:hypothetical protein